jgi:hypothetical protein
MNLIEVVIVISATFIPICILLLLSIRIYVRQKKWIPVDAIVISYTLKTDSTNNTLVEYVVNGNVFQKKCRFARGIWNPLSEGQKVQVLYHPSKPHKIAAHNQLDLISAYFIFFLVAVAIVVIFYHFVSHIL